MSVVHKVLAALVLEARLENFTALGLPLLPVHHRLRHCPGGGKVGGRFPCRPNQGSFETSFSGVSSEGETPVPIPNTEVKPLSADGTALETVWESRSPPGSYFIDGPR